MFPRLLRFLAAFLVIALHSGAGGMTVAAPAFTLQTAIGAFRSVGTEMQAPTWGESYVDPAGDREESPDEVHAPAAATERSPPSAISRFTSANTLVAAVAARGLPSGPVISEFVADNDGGFLDGFGEAADWIELYNPTASPVPLAGWRLRDRTHSWTFPAVTLPAGGFLVVFASDRREWAPADPKGYLHTTFALDAEGEPLALLRPDGSVAWEIADPGSQRRGVSFGLPQSATALSTFSSPARLLVPAGPVAAAWHSEAGFDDGAWRAGQASAGYGVAFERIGGLAAYRVPAGTSGNQDFAGALGMDFVVNRPVVVTELGCFDDRGDGLATTIRVQLWRRNDAGTPGAFGDDTGAEIVAAREFSPADPGTLVEGSRFQPLTAPVTLTPGPYTIVASGYGPGERNGNLGGGQPEVLWETRSGDGALSFVGGSRYGAAGSFPRTVDGGPANRYAAGTFRLAGPDDPLVRTVLPPARETGNPSALMRVRWTVSDPGRFESLTVQLAYDDGCVVWLNGVDVARRFAPLALEYNSAATATTNRWETITLAAGLLSAGTNLLAIHGLNAGVDDGDFFLGAAVTGIATSFAEGRFFARPTPGAPNPAEGAPGFVAEPRFGEARGFRSAPFDLALSCPTPGARIRYTLDGSTPGATNGLAYERPIRIATTTVVRAVGLKEGLEASRPGTHTYLFADDVAMQPSGPPAGYPASWTDFTQGGTYVADYGMIDPATQAARYSRAAGNASYTVDEARAALARSIQALPVVSVTTEPANLFDRDRGIYLHPAARGEAWERPVSVEYFDAGGGESWQVDGGMHVMGLTSRSLQVSPKLNLMLVFGTDYGDAWLRQPFFGADGPSRIKRIALRSNTRDSWLAEYFGTGTATYLADAFAKDSARDSGEPATRHRFCHLFLNGLYWGVYNPTERPEAHWAETTFGGEDEDYDVIDLCCGNQLESGDFVAWRQLLAAAQAGFAGTPAYQAVQGNNPAGARDPALPRLLGVDSFIGFAINGYYHASADWPGNFFVVYDHAADRTAGWRFVTWDTDLGLPSFQLNANKVTPPEGFAHAWWQNSPGVVDAALRANPDYRMRLADRVYREFFRGGAYATPNNLARWNRLRDALRSGLYAESARWGDYRSGGLRTVQDHWLPRVNGAAATNWFARRNATVIQQLRAAGLYPPIDPPRFDPDGGTVPAGFPLVLTNPNSSGRIVYTLDGPDPRGDPAALPFEGPIPIRSSRTVRARVLSGATWSALAEAVFHPAQDLAGLRITEIQYHPPASDVLDGDEFEFLEIGNAGPTPLDLGGVSFGRGIRYAFSNQAVLEPGRYWVLVHNPEAFRSRHPGAPLDGVFEGKLDNDGETLELLDATGASVATVTYGDAAPWPAAADSSGRSLQRMNEKAGVAEPGAWLAADPTPGGPLPPESRDADADGTPDGWETAHGFDPSTPDSAGDADDDGMSNRDEFVAGTDPREAGDRLTLEVLGVAPVHGGVDVVLGFAARPDRTYSVVESEAPTGSVWTMVSQVRAEPEARRVVVTRHLAAEPGARYFRLVTPRLP